MWGPFHVDWPKYFPALLTGLRWTIQYTVVSFLVAALLGMILALLRSASLRPLRWLAYSYTELFKNIPVLTEIFIIYYGLAGVGLKLSSFTAGAAALALFYAAYLAEVFRGALISVPNLQKEAGVSLGFTSGQVTRHVVLPQAIRVALPGTATMLVDLLKTTSLLTTIAAAELMTQAQTITSETFRPMEVYLVIGAIYFVMCFPLSRLSLLLEHKLGAGVAIAPARRSTLRIVRQMIGG